jgi:hypothetical protein
MMIEEIDNMIRHAKAQETTAYQAKKQGYHKLQEHIDRVYGDDLLNHYKVKNYAIQVRPSYESSNIDLYVLLLLENEYEKVLSQAREADEDYRLVTSYKMNTADEVKERVFGQCDFLKHVKFKVKTEEQFERLRNLNH